MHCYKKDKQGGFEPIFLFNWLHKMGFACVVIKHWVLNKTAQYTVWLCVVCIVWIPYSNLVQTVEFDTQISEE